MAQRVDRDRGCSVAGNDDNLTPGINEWRNGMVGEIDDLGISYTEVVDLLEVEGVDKFKVSWSQLQDTVTDQLAQTLPAFAIGQDTGGGGVDAQLMLDLQRLDILPRAQRAVGIHPIFGDEEQRDSARPGGRPRRAAAAPRGAPGPAPGGRPAATRPA